MQYLVRSVPAQCFYLDPRSRDERPFFQYVYADRGGRFDEPVLQQIPTEDPNVHVTASFFGKELANHSTLLHDMIAEDPTFKIRPMATYHIVAVCDEEFTTTTVTTCPSADVVGDLVTTRAVTEAPVISARGAKKAQAKAAENTILMELFLKCYTVGSLINYQGQETSILMQEMHTTLKRFETYPFKKTKTSHKLGNWIRGDGFSAEIKEGTVVEKDWGHKVAWHGFRRVCELT